MKTYTVFHDTIIRRSYTVQAKSEDDAYIIVQDNPDAYDDEEIDENWSIA